MGTKSRTSEVNELASSSGGSSEHRGLNPHLVPYGTPDDVKQLCEDVEAVERGEVTSAEEVREMFADNDLSDENEEDFEEMYCVTANHFFGGLKSKPGKAAELFTEYLTE